jgi:hypothetical protein
MLEITMWAAASNPMNEYWAIRSPMMNIYASLFILNDSSTLKCVKTRFTGAFVGETTGIRTMRANTPVKQ